VAWLEQEFRVRIRINGTFDTPPTPLALSAAVTVVVADAPSDAALAAAAAEVNRVLADPRQFLAKMAKIKSEVVHVFVDESNISLGAQIVPDIRGDHQGAGTSGRGRRDVTVKVDVRQICQVVEGGRDVRSRWCGGSKVAGRPRDQKWQSVALRPCAPAPLRPCAPSRSLSSPIVLNGPPSVGRQCG
jgi:hypothetical protein